MDLSAFSLVELRDLEKQIPAELKRREAAEKAIVRNEVHALVSARGFTLEDIMGKELKIQATAGEKIKVKVKYRHPQDASLAWTGRGRQPKWVEAWLAEGGDLDRLLV